MTQSNTAMPPVNDPWAAAQAAPAPAAVVPQASPVAGGFPPPPAAPAGPGLLFERGNSAPALFNKTHFVGTERTGIITKPSDVQDKDYTTKRLKFWSNSRTGGPQGNGAITFDAFDAPTQTPNRKVMVTHIELDTEYRLTEQEAMAIGRDIATIANDNGKRVEVVGGFDAKPFQDAMADAMARGIKLESYDDLVGLRLTVKRAGQAPPKGGQGNPSWIKTYRLDNA